MRCHSGAKPRRCNSLGQRPRKNRPHPPLRAEGPNYRTEMQRMSGVSPARILAVDSSGLQPLSAVERFFLGVAPGWYNAAPLALRRDDRAVIRETAVALARASWQECVSNQGLPPMAINGRPSRPSDCAARVTLLVRIVVGCRGAFISRRLLESLGEFGVRWQHKRDDRRVFSRGEVLFQAGLL